MDYYDSLTDFKELEGQTLSSVDVNREGLYHEDSILFTTASGKKYKMYHWQSCCEYVSIKDIVGDIEDLIGTPIIVAEETSSTSDECPWPSTKLDPDRFPPPDVDDYDESYTWTFYTLRTIKGTVDISWYGSSNGYYSEGVDFILLGVEDD